MNARTLHEAPMSRLIRDLAATIRALREENAQLMRIARQRQTWNEESLLQAAKAERERDEARLERDRARKLHLHAKQALAAAEQAFVAERERREKVETALGVVIRMRPDKGAKLERAIEIARAALAEGETS